MGKAQQRRTEASITQATDAQLAEQSSQQARQQQVLQNQKEAYKSFEFQNPFAGMENTMEDLTVNTAAADFQAEQGAQQRANLLSGLRGAAGGSGVAGLAQSLANAGTMQARQISVDLGQQQTQNQKLAAQQAGQNQLYERQGAAAVQQAEASRESTLLGMEMGEMAGARAGVQAAYGNQMAGFGAITGMQNARMGMTGQIVGGVAQGLGSAIASDRRLKKNIEYMFDSPSGLPVYNFEYIDVKYGSGVHQGVMSDEIPLEAATTHSDGFDRVNYSLLDVEFKKVN